MNYLIKGTLILFLGCVFFSLQAKEKSIHLSSQNKQFILIELFTSQGCSSCPPAEKWLNQFIKDKELWEKYIPVAFHVDYWDYLGWKDPYSNLALLRGKDVIAEKEKFVLFIPRALL